MMRSVDLASSSASALSTPRNGPSNTAQGGAPSRYATIASHRGPGAPHTQYPQPQQPQYGHQQQHGFGHSAHAVPSSPSSEAGRLKTEQVVVEFLFKVTELVLQSRVHLPSESEHGGRSSRRARFNLDIEEVQFLRDAMGAWKEDVHRPLSVDIFWDGDGREPRVLLERWSVVYASGATASRDSSGNDHYDSPLDFHGRVTRHGSGSGTGSMGMNMQHMQHPANTRDVIQQLKEVVKKIAVVLRALHSFMRLLPAHRFFRQSYPSSLSYEIHAQEPSADTANYGFEPGVATSQYSFIPINTPFGFLKLSTLYRRDCSALERRRKQKSKEMFAENFIIQDYVPASPELVAEPAPQQTTPKSPLRLQETYPDENERRRRSSPEMVKDEATGAQARRGKHISQPMAIPQQVKLPTAYEERSAPSEEPSTAVLQHPHSYGDPERLRSITTNPNVTPAPYGYGNVAIGRDTPPTMNPITGSSGNSGFSGSFRDQLSSPLHPLSTPPRHPSSLLTPKTSRMPLSTSAGKKTGNEYAYRASFENFSLDNSPSQHVSPSASPSPSPSGQPSLPVAVPGRANTFHFGGRLADTSDGAPQMNDDAIDRRLGGNSPQMSPPFMAEAQPQGGNPHERSPSTAALVLRRSSLDSRETSQSLGMPAFASSPPFKAHPSELLSTSPGYSYGKHYSQYRRGTPTFVSTDHPTVGRSTSLRTTGASSGTLVRSSLHKASSQSGSRTFSTDLLENGGGIWGISPDSPDAFGLTIAGSTRHRALSLSGEAEDSAMGQDRNSSSSQGGTSIDSEMMLPFAIGDTDGMSTATTATTTSSVGDRPSFATLTNDDSSTTRGTKWDTASVGSFLQQLKNAPRLEMFGTGSQSADGGVGLTTDVGAATASDGAHTHHHETLFFDDELESFRQLRNEMAHEL